MVRKKQKLFLIFAGTLLFFGLCWTALAYLERQIAPVRSDADTAGSGAPAEASEKPHEFETYLLIGTDGSGREEAEGQEYQGSMADFLFVAVFDKTSRSYGGIQLNRDTMTEITLMQKDGTGMASASLQLCTAHWYGGTKQQSCENTAAAVSKLLGGVTIDGYYAMSMEQIPELNHAVGGVRVRLEEDFTRYDPAMKKGTELLLNDSQAYTFLRRRYHVGNEKNSSRMKRQKQYMKGMFETVKEKSSQDAAFLLKLYQDMKKSAVTNITGKEISHMAKQIKEGENKGIHSPKGTYRLGETFRNGQKYREFYADKKSLKKILGLLYGI